MMGIGRFWRVTLSHSPIVPFSGHSQYAETNNHRRCAIKMAQLRTVVVETPNLAIIQLAQFSQVSLKQSVSQVLA